MQGKNKDLILLGNHLKEIRLNKKQSIENLCFKNNLEPSTISRIENGMVEAKYLTLLKLSKAFDMTLSEMLDFTKKQFN